MENTERVPPGHPSAPPLDLRKSGIWVLTTESGARVLIAVVINPDSMEPIVTATRYAADGNDTQVNGAPMTVAASDPPRIGARWHAIVTAIDSEYPAYQEIVHGGASRHYVTTRIVRIQRLSFDILASMAQ